jgi:hypothetical protein
MRAERRPPDTRRYGVVAAGEALAESDFDALVDEEDESLEPDDVLDEADALVPFSLVLDSDLAPSALASVDSDVLFPAVPFL